MAKIYLLETLQTTSRTGIREGSGRGHVDAESRFKVC